MISRVEAGGAGSSVLQCTPKIKATCANTDPTNRQYIIIVSNSTLISLQIRESNGTAINKHETISQLSKSQWYNIVGVANGSSLRLYLNGVEIGSGVSYDGTINTGNSDFIIGKLRPSDDLYPFNGKLDEISFWNIALSEEEIQANMYSELTGSESGLVGYWNFNAGIGDTLYDHSGNGNHGTINGGARWITNGTKHVSTAENDGSDETGNGSVDSPFGSIQYAIDMTSEGDSG